MKKKTTLPVSDNPVIEELAETESQEIVELQNQVRNLNDSWKRALADYQNLLKRGETERSDMMKYVGRTMVTKFIPVLDILEMAVIHTKDQGVEMAVNQFHQVLKEEGLEQIIPNIGDVFDHAIHECIEIVSGEPAETVAEVVLKGYKIGDYVIRPSKVKVYKN